MRSQTQHNTGDPVTLEQADATDAPPTAATLSPQVAISVKDALYRYGIGRTKLYELLRNG